MSCMHDYKPLMHLWYIGVLMQAYVALPVLYYLFIKVFKNVKRGMWIGTICLTSVSFFLYMLPVFSAAWKFYYLPFRMFEITIGGFLCLGKMNIQVADNLRTDEKSLTIKPYDLRLILPLAFLFLMIFARTVFISQRFMLIIVVLATTFLIKYTWNIQITNGVKNIIAMSAVLGRASYSIYIWHQCIIAFLFYSFFYKNDPVSFPVFLVLTVCFSFISYRFIEKPLGNIVGFKKKELTVFINSVLAAFVLCFLSLWIYFHAGVVRDVPELNINKQNIKRNMHKEYSDRPYKWDRDFANNGNLRILVLGNSFGRDWANILYEFDNKLDISYIFYTEKNLQSKLHRIKNADVVFYAMGPSYEQVPEYVKTNVPTDKLYVIGNKNYGESNGIIYAKKGTNNYYKQSVFVPQALINENKEEANLWGKHYVDMLSPVTNVDGSIRVFTEDKKFVSQDCRHLTEAGAKYYSKILDIKGLLKI